MTMKDGRLSFSLPRPYDSQEPRLALPGICAPVQMYVTAGSWLIASVCTDLMNEILSACFAIFGSSSLIHAPDWPCCLNLNMLGATGKRDWPDVIVVRRCPLMIDGGRSLSNISSIFGL